MVLSIGTKQRICSMQNLSIPKNTVSLLSKAGFLPLIWCSVMMFWWDAAISQKNKPTLKW